MTAGSEALHVPGLDGGALDIPYRRVRGDRPGPHLTVLAGVHGTEYTSIAAVREFVAALDPGALRGTVTAVPVVNLQAFWSRTPFVVPADGKNLNRSFPGDPGGTDAEVLAHAVFTAFVRPADAVVDAHAGDLPEALEPFVLYEESGVQARARELALAYGLGHVVRQTRAARTVAGSTAAAAADAGIPAIIAESGQQGLLTRPAVEAHLQGLANVLALLGMVEHPPAPPATAQVEHEGWHWLRSPRAGWWEPAVPAGAVVDTGDPLGSIADLLGGDPTPVRAPVPGTVLFLTASPAVLADGLLLGLAVAP